MERIYTYEHSNSKIIEAELAKGLIGLKVMAYKDYISSRILFNNLQLVNACQLAATCLEKEFKIWLSVLGKQIPQKHDLTSLYNTIYHSDPSIATFVNKDYLKVLSQIYLSRYYEKLRPGYNYVILKNKFLATLDYIYSMLEPLTRIQPDNIKDIRDTAYVSGIREKTPQLLLNNFILAQLPLNKFLEQPEQVWEFRILPNNQPLEIKYTLVNGDASDNYIYTGVKMKEGIINEFDIVFVPPNKVEGVEVYYHFKLTGPEFIA